MPTIDNPRPAYRLIADQLREDIRSGKLRAGDALPSEQQLEERTGRSRIIVRQAFAVLRNEGLIDVERGRRSRVRTQERARRLSPERFSRAERARGRGTDSTDLGTDAADIRDLRLWREPAEPWVAELLEVPAGEELIMRSWRCFVEDEPTWIGTSYRSASLWAGTALEVPEALHGAYEYLIEEKGIAVGEWTDTITARMPSPDEAHALGIVEGSGTPVIRILQICRASDGLPLAVEDMLLSAPDWELVYRVPAT